MNDTRRIQFQAPDTIPQSQLLEALRVLGFNPDTVRRVDLEPRTVTADLYAIDEGGQKAFVGGQPVLHSITIHVTGEQ